ncbi:MAG: GNAT family N-acetyltransferase [Bacteriovoracaceae bacterium]|nr:GNAT family N-acetyltransferase [Bacteriovoracaceae bacterium]
MKGRDRTINILRLNPFINHSQVEVYWKELQNKSRVSFFNSWSWISCWLETLPKDSNLELIVVRSSNEVICCFFLGITQGIKNKFYKKRGYLNSLGDYHYDSLVVEYNSVLCKEGLDSEDILKRALDSLKDIEEFRLPLTVDINIPSDDYFKREETYQAYWTDLDKIRQESDYSKLISKNKRSQIKRSLKEYEKQGEVALEFACSLTKAKDFFTNLEELHQKEWTKRGEPGAFSNPFFKEFHSRLIEKCFNNNEVQLARVFTPKEDIGYLYYFIHNNEILFYQSGFNYKQSNLYRPGLICHYIATKACAEKNYLKYNFLAGDAQYKKSLSTNQDKLNSLVISRKTIKSQIEQLLRKVGGKA